jgi:hypothetical protein
VPKKRLLQENSAAFGSNQAKKCLLSTLEKWSTAEAKELIGTENRRGNCFCVLLVMQLVMLRLICCHTE